MDKRQEFIKSQMSEEEENMFLSKNFTSVMEKQLKNRYAEILDSEHGITRSYTRNKKKLANNVRLLSIIGSVAAMFVLGFLFWPASPSPNELALTYIENDFYENKNIKRGDINTDLLRADAITAYNNKDFGLAKSKYSAIENLSREDQFFYGMSLMYNGEYDEAIVRFNQLMPLKQFKYIQEVQWFNAICLVRNGQFDKAKTLLEKQKEWKKEEATELLKALR